MGPGAGVALSIDAVKWWWWESGSQHHRKTFTFRSLQMSQLWVRHCLDLLRKHLRICKTQSHCFRFFNSFLETPVCGLRLSKKRFYCMLGWPSCYLITSGQQGWLCLKAKYLSTAPESHTSWHNLCILVVSFFYFFLATKETPVLHKRALNSFCPAVEHVYVHITKQMQTSLLVGGGGNE